MSDDSSSLTSQNGIHEQKRASASTASLERTASDLRSEKKKRRYEQIADSESEEQLDSGDDDDYGWVDPGLLESALDVGPGHIIDMEDGASKVEDVDIERNSQPKLNEP